MDKALVFSELAPNVKCAIFPDGMCLMYPDGEPDSSGNVVMKCSAEQPERVLAGWGQGPWDWKASVGIWKHSMAQTLLLGPIGQGTKPLL